MDLGLEQAGFESIAGLELDANARETLRLNRPDWPIWEKGDVIAAAETLQPSDSAGPFHWDNRPLSIRERMRLQSFPDDWLLAGGFRDQVKLVGNATPPLLAELLGRRVAASFLGKHPAGSLAGIGLLRTPASFQPKPGTVRPIPDEYRTLVGPRDPHAGTGKGPAPRLVEEPALKTSESVAV